MRITDKISLWSFESNEYLEIHRSLQFLDRVLFSDYEPTQSPRSDYPTFYNRLSSWLNNAPKEEQQKQYFKLLTKLLYIGRDEITSLMTSAYSTAYMQWIVRAGSIRLSPTTFSSDFAAELRATWFCPTTDSFRINQFFHINGLASSASHRPDWRSLKKFGDTARIQKYLTDNKYSRVVLLEDFVGTGTQINSIIKFIGMKFPAIPFLLTPLICAKDGYERMLGTIHDGGYGNITVTPVVLLDKRATLGSLPKETRQVILRGRKQLLLGCTAEQRANIESYNLDLLSVLFSNTPNNSAPELYMHHATWNPLFPRVQRD